MLIFWSEGRKEVQTGLHTILFNEVPRAHTHTHCIVSAFTAMDDSMEWRIWSQTEDSEWKECQVTKKNNVKLSKTKFDCASCNNRVPSSLSEATLNKLQFVKIESFSLAHKCKVTLLRWVLQQVTHHLEKPIERTSTSQKI